MQLSPLGTALLSLSVAFALASVLTSNLTWVVASIALMTVLISSRMQFVGEIERANLEIKRTVLESMIFSEEPVGVKIEILNKDVSPMRGTFIDILPEDCERAGGSNEVTRELPPRTVLTFSYSLTVNRRGPHVMEGVKLKRFDSCKLFEHEQLIEHRTGLTAHTRRESFETARKMAGRKHLDFSGVAANPAIVLRELEFDGIRDYIPGDRARDIHWKLYPKLGKLMTKVYKKEGSLQTMILVDCGRSMRLGSGAIGKVDHALDLAMQISSVLLASLQPTGVAAFDEMHIVNRVSPSLGRHQFEKIVKTLSTVPGTVKIKKEARGLLEESANRFGANRPQMDAAKAEHGAFLAVLDVFAAQGRTKLGLGVEGAVKEAVAKGKGRKLLFIVITDLISSRDAVLAAARICSRTGNKMLVIHTFDDWYIAPKEPLEVADIERLYGNLTESLGIEGALRGLGAKYTRIGPADSASNLVKEIRRGRV